MNNPLISVIVPVYNVSGYLREAIDSVIQQTYTNWELLLVDDGSTDGSTDIALEYVQALPDKVRYLQHPGDANKGLPASRNLGMVHAKGSYLALLDADDYWLPEKLAYQVSVARQFPQAAMICGASLYWYSWADKERDDMVKKEVTANYRGFEETFIEKFQLYEDQAFFMKIYLHEPVYISSKVMDRYRQRPDSIMSQSAADNDYDEVRFFYLKWLLNYLKREKIAMPEVNKKLKKALWQYRNPLLFKIKSKILNL